MLDSYAGIALSSNDGDNDNNHPPSFPEDNNEAFDTLVRSYKEDYGTEGHDLDPYRDLFSYCQASSIGRQEDGINSNGGFGCEVRIHGGFILRNHAGRLNKECPDLEAKQKFFPEMSTERGYLPQDDDAMNGALFEDKHTFRLRGTREHRIHIKSMMRGTNIYDPTGEDVRGDDDEYEEEEMNDQELHIVIIKIHIICLFFATSIAYVEAARRHINPLNIELIFMDVMCCDVGRMPQLHVGA
jgi:hypothetical protein